MMHLVSQPSTISPPTPTYNPNICGSTSTSYTPYGLSPQNNPYFPFPGLPRKIAPPPGKPHVGVYFVHPSPIQQVHAFEQLNMENLAHQLNNAKKKGKNQNNNNPRPGGNNPNKTNPLGATRIKATKTPKGETITINHDKGRTINLELNSLVLYVVSMYIILTTSPNLSSSNG
jgi:hypothetical protein